MGSLLYRAATGRAPFGRDRVEDALDALAHEKPLDPRELVASTPVELVRLLAGLLEKDPALRIESVEQTLIELRALRLPVRPDALPARMALREWLKGALLPSRRSLEGDGFHEVTAEYDLPGTLTDEGPNASDG